MRRATKAKLSTALAILALVINLATWIFKSAQRKLKVKQ